MHVIHILSQRQWTGLNKKYTHIYMSQLKIYAGHRTKGELLSHHKKFLVTGFARSRGEWNSNRLSLECSSKIHSTNMVLKSKSISVATKLTTRKHNLRNCKEMKNIWFVMGVMDFVELFSSASSWLKTIKLVRSLLIYKKIEYSLICKPNRTK